MNIQVLKRNGSLEPIDESKISKCVKWACEGVEDVSQSQIELKAKIQFYDGITTADIHEAVVRAASDLITAYDPGYSQVAGRLNVFGMRKEAFGDYTPPHLYNHVTRMVDAGLYTEELLQKFSEDELKELNDYIVHDRDLDFEYAATVQLRSKYLVQVRSEKGSPVKESPQIAFMLIAAVLHMDEPVAEGLRLRLIKRFYDMLSTFDISLPTPIMAGVRTPTKQFSSCVLIEADDDLDSINAVSHAIAKYVSKRAGIGINGGHIRALGSKIGTGEVMHTGVLPFWRQFQSSVKSCSQGGLRNGAATLHYPIWHREVMNLLPLKNNTGTDENRLRQMDYSVQTCKFFEDRFKAGKNISLFSPDVANGELYKLFYEDMDKFAELYEELEANESISRKSVKAVDLFVQLAQERIQTGRIYLHFVDISSKGTPFNPELAPVRQSNLCVVGETKILTDKGYQEISTLKDQNIKVWNGFEFAPTTVRQTGSDCDVVKVSTKNHKELVCTPEHKFYIQSTYHGKPQEVRAKDLRPGDKLIKCAFPIVEGQKPLENAYINGFFTGDGCRYDGKNIVYLYKEKRKLLPKFEPVAKHVWHADARITLQIPNSRYKFFVPDSEYTVQARLEWLAGYLDADGTVNRNGTNESIMACSVNLEFLKALREMLETLGVTGAIVPGSLAGYQEMPDGRGATQLYYCQKAYRLVIASVATQKLIRLGLLKYLGRLHIWERKPNRAAAHFDKVASVTKVDDLHDTFCFTEPKRHLGVFNGLLTGQCQEILLPTKPLHGTAFDPEAEIALCTLAAVNMGKVSPAAIPVVMTALVRALDNLLSYQDYLLPAAERSVKQFRPLGIGVINYAYWLARQGFKYGEGLSETRIYFENLLYWGLDASVRLSEQRGQCEGFGRTKYASGWLKIDQTSPSELTCNWEGLRARIKRSGVRNATLLALMPSETSSQISNATNGIEPPRGLMSIKKSKDGVIRQVVPESLKLGMEYDLCWSWPNNDGYLKAVREMQKFVCQATSVNLYYDPAKFPNGKTPVQQVLKDIFKARGFGIPTLYYHNTRDGQTEQPDDCAGGGCKI